jgi:hypothetical protein
MYAEALELTSRRRSKVPIAANSHMPNNLGVGSDPGSLGCLAFLEP